MKTIHVSENKATGTKIVTGTAVKDRPKQGPKTVSDKNKEIQKERVTGRKKVEMVKNGSWRKPEDGLQFLAGHDTGIISWLTPVFCAFFGLQDCGYKNSLRIWNFPPSIDDPKKKHTVTRQFYYTLKDKYVLVDVFDAETPQKKIDLIKAWLEALGYRYTYILGGDLEKGVDTEEFADLVFEDRLKLMDPKAKDYPKFKVPQNYQEAGLAYGGTIYEK